MVPVAVGEIDFERPYRGRENQTPRTSVRGAWLHSEQHQIRPDDYDMLWKRPYSIKLGIEDFENEIAAEKKQR